MGDMTCATPPASCRTFRNRRHAVEAISERWFGSATPWRRFPNGGFAPPRHGGGFRTVVWPRHAVEAVSERRFGSPTPWRRFPNGGSTRKNRF